MKVVASEYLKENLFLHRFYKVAVFLHPLYKGLQKFCADQQEREEIHLIVKDMMIINQEEI